MIIFEPSGSWKPTVGKFFEVHHEKRAGIVCLGPLTITYWNGRSIGIKIDFLKGKRC